MAEIIAFPSRAPKDGSDKSDLQPVEFRNGAELGANPSQTSEPARYAVRRALPVGVGVSAEEPALPIPLREWIAMTRALAFYANQGFDHGAMAREALGAVIGGQKVKDQN